MADGESLDPPHEVKRADAEKDESHQQDDYSDSEDQFTDAQSAPMTPHLSSPSRKTQHDNAAEAAPEDESQEPEDDAEAESGDALPTASSENTLDTIVEKAAEIETPTQEREQAEIQDQGQVADEALEAGNDDDDGFGDDFGDDFDDFAEGEEADETFDEFDNSFAQPEQQQPPQGTGTPTPAAPQKPPPFPIPDFDGLSTDEVISTTEDLLSALYPPETSANPPSLPPLSKDASIFINPRSASLWSQLVAPPPLSPPDWIRSRTRRLFLVSLGVPVDLDEILPKSKQKKLVLPSLHLSANSPRASTDSRSVSRLKQGDGNNSTTSVDTQGKPKASASAPEGGQKRKGPPPEPDLDLVAARYLCSTTDEALDGMTDGELKTHVSKLEAMQGTANDALEYWKKRTDEKIGDREAFEGVIENLVKHARKVRK